MVKVIINADDLGKNSQVNEAIRHALASNIISSSSIMANSEYWDEIHGIVNQNPQASFGIHLNLTEGKAMTDNPVFFRSGIVDEDNCFTKKIRELSDYTDEILLAVKNEWLAQIKKVIEIEGIKVTHIDGHHHIHTFYPFCGILEDCLKQYGVLKLRNRYGYPQRKFTSVAYKMISVLGRSNLAISFLDKVKNSNSYLNLFYRISENEHWRKRIYRSFTTTDYFDSYEHFCDVANNLRKIDNATVELMCHPGHSSYEFEFSAIKEHALEKRIPFNLISYREL